MDNNGNKPTGNKGKRRVQFAPTQEEISRRGFGPSSSQIDYGAPNYSNERRQYERAQYLAYRELALSKYAKTLLGKVREHESILYTKRVEKLKQLIAEAKAKEVLNPSLAGPSNITDNRYVPIQPKSTVSLINKDGSVPTHPEQPKSTVSFVNRDGSVPTYPELDFKEIMHIQGAI
jgi:hypothetical protein